jgi:Uma2 family endonuclease
MAAQYGPEIVHDDLVSGNWRGNHRAHSGIQLVSPAVVRQLLQLGETHARASDAHSRHLTSSLQCEVRAIRDDGDRKVRALSIEESTIAQSCGVADSATCSSLFAALARETRIFDAPPTGTVFAPYGVRSPTGTTMLRSPPMDGHHDMQPASATKLTYDDFLSFPDDGQRHELIDGQHYVTPSPFTAHQRVARNLITALHTYLKHAGIGEAFVAPFDIVLSRYDVVEPDVFVVLHDQREIVTDKHVHGTPAIVVEILSRGTRRRDAGVKRRLYERSGVREYWLVDPDDAAVAIYRRTAAERLTAADQLSRDRQDRLTSPLLSGFELALMELFSS